jgi:centromeric protein E
MTSLMSLAGDLVGGFLGTVKQSQVKEVVSADTSIQVCVRVRPILRNEKEDTDSYAWNWEDKTLYPQIANQLPYTFDHLFFPESTNEEIFDDVVKNVVLQSMNGYNGSIFTYGQTSSGKTFTMNGSHSQPGIIPQSIYFCFKSIQDSFPEREFLFRVSYIEVYNEQIKDLLNSEPAHIKIQTDPKLGTILSGVKEQVVLSPQQVIALIRAGEAQRHIGSTDMNESSSRAHTVFKLIIESRKRGDSTDAPVRSSFLNLIDLAGSENAKMTNSTGDRAREAKHINQSLLTLSLIIFKLSEEKPGATKKTYYPYRDSKLTRLLQSSLSGNAKIAVICTVSPTLRCVDETHNTLRFATRAKKIKTHACVNELMDDKTLLKAYKLEINVLKARLAAMEGSHIQGMGLLPSPFLQIMNGMKESKRTGSTDDNDGANDDNEIESEGLILQVCSMTGGKLSSLLQAALTTLHFYCPFLESSPSHLLYCR